MKITIAESAPDLTLNPNHHLTSVVPILILLKLTLTVQQETLLRQTDRATRCVNQYLVNCRNKLYNKSATNGSNGVRGLQLIDLW